MNPQNFACCSEDRVSSGVEAIDQMYNLAQEVIDRVSQLRSRGACAKQWLQNKITELKQYTREHGEDLPSGEKA